MTAVSTYSDLLVVLRAHRLTIGMSLLDVDARAGFQEGYTGKLEAYALDEAGRRKANTKAISIVNLFNWLGAVGLSIEVLDAPDAKRSAKHAPLTGYRHTILEPHLADFQKRRMVEWARRTSKKASSLGGKASAANLSKQGRRARAKRAARARWAKRPATARGERTA